MCTLHTFPRSHCNQPVLEQQLAILALALVERYGTDIAVSMLNGIALDIQGLALQAAVQQ